MNTCPSCGKPIDPGAAFCGNCGQALAVQQTPTVIASPLAENTQVQPSPIVQVLNNQQPASMTIPNNPAPAVAGAASLPAYAKEYVEPAARTGEIEATIGLLLGVIAVPAALFLPVLALALGGAGIVLGTLGRSKYRHTLSLMAVIFPVIGILAGFAVFGIAASSTSKSLAQSNTGSASSASMLMVDTPCYSVKIDGGLKNFTHTNCNFDAASSSEEFRVDALNDPSITATNLNQVAPGIFQQAISKAGDTYVSGAPGMFADNPAYIVYADNAADGSKGIYAMVIHQASAVNNVYFVSRVIRTTHTPVFGPMEANWQWK